MMKIVKNIEILSSSWTFVMSSIVGRFIQFLNSKRSDDFLWVKFFLCLFKICYVCKWENETQKESDLKKSLKCSKENHNNDECIQTPPYKWEKYTKEENRLNSTRETEQSLFNFSTAAGVFSKITDIIRL